MRTYEISPLWRSTIGFDRFLDLVDAARHADADANYPPCNVERLSDDRYRISLALAGFSPDDIALTAEQNVLTVEGRKANKGQPKLLYRGAFHRGRSSGSSFWPHTSGSREHDLTTACSRSSWFERFRTP